MPHKWVYAHPPPPPPCFHLYSSSAVFPALGLRFLWTGCALPPSVLMSSPLWCKPLTLHLRSADRKQLTGFYRTDCPRTLTDSQCLWMEWKEELFVFSKTETALMCVSEQNSSVIPPFKCFHMGTIFFLCLIAAGNGALFEERLAKAHLRRKPLIYAICTTHEQMSCVQLVPKNAHMGHIHSQRLIFSWLTSDGIYIDFIFNTSMFDRVLTVD